MQHGHFCLPQRDHTLTVAVNTAAHRTGSPVCGHQPGKEPMVVVDCAVLVTVHPQPTVRTAIDPRVVRHGLQMPAPTAPLGTSVLVYVRERRRRAKTHLYESIWTNWYRPQSLYTARCRVF